MQVGNTADSNGNTTIEGSLTIVQDRTTYTCSFKFSSNDIGSFSVSPSGNIIGSNPGSSNAGDPSQNTLSYNIFVPSVGRS